MNDLNEQCKATFNFNEVVIIKKALKVYLAILEAQFDSAYELSHNEDFIRACETMDTVKKYL